MHLKQFKLTFRQAKLFKMHCFAKIITALCVISGLWNLDDLRTRSLYNSAASKLCLTESECNKITLLRIIHLLQSSYLSWTLRLRKAPGILIFGVVSCSFFEGFEHMWWHFHRRSIYCIVLLLRMGSWGFCNVARTVPQLDLSLRTNMEKTNIS